MQWRRWWRHARAWRPRAEVLDAQQTQALADCVRDMEAQHHAEIRICLERHWPWDWAIGAATPRERALHWFVHEHVWDTEGNTGVLVYVSLADRAIEIVADRGLNACISPEQWQGVVHAMRERFAQGHYADGLLAALRVLQDLLDAHLPKADVNPNELPNQVLIK